MAEKVSLNLKWDSHQKTVLQSLETSYGAQDFVDLTLACEGQSVQAHRVVVSASSSFLKRLLQDHPAPHPIIILKDITMTELKQLLEFMYCGQVTVGQHQLDSLLHAAHVLGIQGLTDVDCSEGTQSTSCMESEEEVNKTDTDYSTRNEIITLSANKHFLPSTPSSAKSLSLAELLSQPVLNTNAEIPAYDQQNNGSVNDSLSEIDLDVKQEEVDLGVESEYQDTQSEDMAVDLDNNLNSCPKGIGKATAFMLTLAKRANQVAAPPYLAHRSADLIGTSSLTVPNSSTFMGQNVHHEDTSTVHSKDFHLIKRNSGHWRTNDASAEHKLAFYEARPCSVCGKMFRAAATLRKHMSRAHTASRHGFQCTCMQTFDTKYEMSQHRKSHGKNGRA